MSGTLFVVPTPIGNLEDLTLRAARVLKETEVIAAEDTRSARFLLDHIGAGKKTIISYFDGNEAARSEQLLTRLAAGESIALVSEAGTPGVSDPGQRVVAAAIAAGVRVEVLPGACAAIVALVGSGLSTDEFRFVGFLPREEGARQERLGKLRGEIATMIFYEAPARVATTIGDLSLAFGESRMACVARELTKIHEEYARESLAELMLRYSDEAPRGEVVILVEGASVSEGALSDEEIEREIAKRVAAGEGAKEIAAAMALKTGKPRRQLYQLAISKKR